MAYLNKKKEREREILGAYLTNYASYSYTHSSVTASHALLLEIQVWRFCVKFRIMPLLQLAE